MFYSCVMSLCQNRHMASILCFAAGAAVALVLLPAAGPSRSTGSGLYGTVRKGPVMPVCQIGVPCDAAVQMKLIAFSTARSSGETMETDQEAIRTDKHGRYRIALAPGFYEVRSVAKIGMTKLPKPHAVHIRTGHWDKINLFF